MAISQKVGAGQGATNRRWGQDEINKHSMQRTKAKKQVI